MTTAPTPDRPRFAWWQKFLIGLGAAVLVIAIVLSVLAGIFYWITEVSKTKLGQSTSPDGSHTAVAYEVGSPILFGSNKVRVILSDTDGQINRLDTTIANDGVGLDQTNVILSWDEGAAVAILSGSEQSTLQCKLFFTGGTDCEGFELQSEEPTVSAPPAPIAPNRQMSQELFQQKYFATQRTVLDAIAADASELGFEAHDPEYDANAKGELFLRVNRGTNARGFAFEDRLICDASDECQTATLVRKYVGDAGLSQDDEILGTFSYDPATGDVARIE